MYRSISFATDQGSRSYQEDRFVVRTVEIDTHSGMLIAVADGHGGYETSSYVTDQLSSGLFDKMLADSKNGSEALELVFQYINDATLELSRRTTTHFESGTTLSVVYVSNLDHRSHIAIIGDSPVILVRKDGSLHLSPEHNVRSNEQERKAAIQRGGVIEGGYLYSKSTAIGLQMTRDIGCHAMGNILRRLPDIYDLVIGEGDSIIVGSDGLFDPAHRDTLNEVTRLSRLVLEGANAQDLVNDALNRQTGDNVTAIVYKRCRRSGLK